MNIDDLAGCESESEELSDDSGFPVATYEGLSSVTCHDSDPQSQTLPIHNQNFAGYRDSYPQLSDDRIKIINSILATGIVVDYDIE